MVGSNGHGIEELRRRFADWRRTRARGTRIPETLWQGAIEAARERGVHRTSKQLGVDYYSLARRLNGKARAAAGDIELVEFPGKVFSAAPGCVVEIQDGKGRRLRVELRDAVGAELLVRTLWKTRR